MDGKTRPPAVASNRRRTGDAAGVGHSSSMDQCTTTGCARQAPRAGNDEAATEVRGGVLYRAARGSLEMLRAPQGWAFDTSILEGAEQAGARRVEVYDLDSGDTYRAALADFWERGVRVERGCRRQFCLPLLYWRVERACAPRRPAAPRTGGAR